MKKTMIYFLTLCISYVYQSNATGFLETIDSEGNETSQSFKPAFPQISYDPYEAKRTEARKYWPTLLTPASWVASSFPKMDRIRAWLVLSPIEGDLKEVSLDSCIGRTIKFKTPALSDYNYLQLVHVGLYSAPDAEMLPMEGEDLNAILNRIKDLPEPSLSLSEVLSFGSSPSYNPPLTKSGFMKDNAESGYKTMTGYTLVYSGNILVLVFRRNNSPFFINNSQFGPMENQTLANFTFIDNNY